MGAVMSLAMALSKDRPPVAGVLAFSGFMPNVEGWQPHFEDRRDTRVFIAHGRRDPIMSVEFARRARQVVVAVGLRVDYHESDAGHHIDGAHLSAATEWLADAIPP